MSLSNDQADFAQAIRLNPPHPARSAVYLAEKCELLALQKLSLTRPEK